ncbi:MAG: hypothetical protein ACREHG_05145 [Candidatus Saccharimonadales bacterium]
MKISYFFGYAVILAPLWLVPAAQKDKAGSCPSKGGRKRSVKGNEGTWNAFGTRIGKEAARGAAY